MEETFIVFTLQGDISTTELASREGRSCRSAEKETVTVHV